MVSKTAIPFLNPPPRPSGAKGMHRGAGVVAPAPGADAPQKPQAKPQPRQRQKTPKPEGPLKKQSASAQRRAAHKADLETRIVEAARGLFVERGQEAVTLREVAAAVGYSHATIYSFFSDKAELLARLVEEAGRDFAERLAAQIEAADRPGSLARVVAVYLRWAAAHPHHYRLLMQQPGAAGAVYALLRGLAAAEGGDAELRAQTWWAALHGAALLEIEQAQAGSEGGPPWRELPARIEALARWLSAA
ncbi:TetR family transcriptional regulator [Roseateles sp. DAIF2]|uniref:TetR/AcrR family transcriptional regulator n=1 Tax=Roseateles sp. DAIF2 TaxID=2714952 RepID=UPI0018A28D83|nr:TetR/AcrR family transcriptional regulator [Roseateles sp. DAIF2]QPF75771.1 TetR family transcriptional regulator [Roseateles sp. DAIF2]